MTRPLSLPASAEVSRRAFLKATGCLALGSALPTGGFAHHSVPSSAKACIQILLVGGPSQLETFDPKPNAPSEVRGPFLPIASSVPGLSLCEHLPKLSQRAKLFSLVRSLHHEEAPIHETGQQLVQTGRLAALDNAWPHVGAMLAHQQPAREVPTWAVLQKLGSTGVQISQGQSSGPLGLSAEPTVFSLADMRKLEAGLPTQGLALRSTAQARREAFGKSDFARSCFLAKQMVEQGVRFVTINMFETVFGQLSWDCHANQCDLATTLLDYRTLCPLFDQALSALLDELADSGLLDSTLVLAAGEFGRTPTINARGGRDHWPGVWSALLAGGGVQGGQVLGSSDAWAAEPKDQPIHASSLAATLAQALGVNQAEPCLDHTGMPKPLVQAPAILDLF